MGIREMERSRGPNNHRYYWCHPRLKSLLHLCLVSVTSPKLEKTSRYLYNFSIYFIVNFHGVISVNTRIECLQFITLIFTIGEWHDH